MQNKQEVGISFLPDANYSKLTHKAAEIKNKPFDVISSYEDLGFPSPLLQLIVLAQYSDSARIGPACLVVPKYNTIETIVSQLALLDSLRPGKVFLGLAPGAWLEQVGLGLAKVAHLEEAIASFTYLLNKKTEGFNGLIYKIKPGFSVQYQLPQDIPIMVGAWGEKMLKMAGKNAHVTEVKGGGSANSQMVGLLKQRLNPGLSLANRPATEVGVVLGAVTVVDKNRGEAMKVAKRRAAMYINVIGEKDPFAMAEFSREIINVKTAMAEGKVDEAAKAIPDELARLFVFAGSPKDIIEQALSIYRAGAKRIEFGSPHGIDEVKGVRLLANEVLPVLQKELTRNSL